MIKTKLLQFDVAYIFFQELLPLPIKPFPPHPPPPTIQSCFLIHFSLFPSFSVLSWGVKEVFTIWQSTGIKTNLSNKHTQTNILTGGYILQPSPSSNFFFSKIKKQTYVKIEKCNKTKLNVKLTTKFKRL